MARKKKSAPVAHWFQCSSASRKFLNRRLTVRRAPTSRRFSALQRAENSSIKALSASRSFLFQRFQCSSASRKFLNDCARCAARGGMSVSVLFSEPKIPQSSQNTLYALGSHGFSALQRAENSSIPTLAPASIHISDRDDHASSFLSLPGASP